jgi:hypothetical protein
MYKQASGLASLLSTYLIDKFPTAIYEGNQRLANIAPKKEMMVEVKLLKVYLPWLGYKPNFYRGLRSTRSILRTLLRYDHLAKKIDIANNKRNFRKRINWTPDYSPFYSNDLESAPSRFFSRIKLIEATNSDDNYLRLKIG